MPDAMQEANVEKLDNASMLRGALLSPPGRLVSVRQNALIIQ